MQAIPGNVSLYVLKTLSNRVHLTVPPLVINAVSVLRKQRHDEINKSSGRVHLNDDYFSSIAGNSLSFVYLETKREIRAMKWGKKGIEMDQLILILIGLFFL
mgnify:CR=1 FL=1